MGQRSRTIPVGVLLILITAAILAVGAVRAVPANAAETGGSKGEVNLGPKQRAEFVKGAKEVAGLNDQQISMALKDPEMLYKIPVKSTVQTSEKVTSPAPSATGRLQAQAYAPKCKTFQHVKQLVDIKNRPMLSFTGYKTWCFNGEHVLSSKWSPKPPNMKIVAWIREDVKWVQGRKDGYRYVKSAERRSNSFVPFEGRWHGGHRSVGVGRFEWRIIGLNETPEIIKANIGRIGTYDGRCNSAGKRFDNPLEVVHPK